MKNDNMKDTHSGLADGICELCMMIWPLVLIAYAIDFVVCLLLHTRFLAPPTNLTEWAAFTFMMFLFIVPIGRWLLTHIVDEKTGNLYAVIIGVPLAIVTVAVAGIAVVVGYMVGIVAFIGLFMAALGHHLWSNL